MREIVSISLDSKLKNKLDKIAKRKNLKRSSIIKDALNKYLIIEEVKNFQNEFRPLAEKSGFFNEEDIFKVVS